VGRWEEGVRNKDTVRRGGLRGGEECGLEMGRRKREMGRMEDGWMGRL